MELKEQRSPEYMSVGSHRTSDLEREKALISKIERAQFVIRELRKPLKRQADFAATLDRRVRGQSEAEIVLSKLEHDLKEWL